MGLLGYLKGFAICKSLFYCTVFASAAKQSLISKHLPLNFHELDRRFSGKQHVLPHRKSSPAFRFTPSDETSGFVFATIGFIAQSQFFIGVAQQ